VPEECTRVCKYLDSTAVASEQIAKHQEWQGLLVAGPQPVEPKDDVGNVAFCGCCRLQCHNRHASPRVTTDARLERMVGKATSPLRKMDPPSVWTGVEGSAASCFVTAWTTSSWFTSAETTDELSNGSSPRQTRGEGVGVDRRCWRGTY
jgi:hypothetical protein